jgi:hypothetical protein
MPLFDNEFHPDWTALLTAGNIMKNVATYIAIALGFVAYNAMTSADRDDSGAIISEGNVDAFQIQVGDCFDDTSMVDAGAGGEVTDLPGVPCARPHDNEVFAVFDVGVANFPEGDEMGKLAFESCMNRFQSFVGRDYQSSSLDIMTLHPTRESWDRRNDREVICAVYDMEENKLRGSTKGQAL